MSTQPEEQDAPKNDREKSGGFLAVVQSTLAALLGVQSGKNRERDFKQKDASQYIIAGIITVFILLIGMYTLVSYVISTAKPH